MTWTETLEVTSSLSCQTHYYLPFVTVLDPCRWPSRRQICRDLAPGTSLKSAVCPDYCLRRNLGEFEVWPTSRNCVLLGRIHFTLLTPRSSLSKEHSLELHRTQACYSNLNTFHRQQDNSYRALPEHMPASYDQAPGIVLISCVCPRAAMAVIPQWSIP